MPAWTICTRLVGGGAGNASQGVGQAIFVSAVPKAIEKVIAIITHGHSEIEAGLDIPGVVRGIAVRGSGLERG
jgi:hypothetical protein